LPLAAFQLIPQAIMGKTPLPPAFYLRIVAALVAAAILAIGVSRAVLHLHDLSGMRHIAGDWMALAQSLNRGVLYPPLEEDGYYAGTRYMPLFFCLIAGVEREAGDYLLATKLVTLVSVLALVSSVFAVVRRVTGRWLEALTLSGLVLAFPEGLMALLAPHADALAVALSLWGLFFVASEKPRTGEILLAALLMALAIGTKFSAAAAPAAAVVYLLPRQTKSGITLAIAFLVFVLMGLGLVHYVSQGRFEENFRALASGGMTLAFMKSGPARLGIGLLTSSVLFAFVAPLVLPLALLTIVQNFRTRVSLWDLYFLLSIGTTLVIMMSPGTDLNHLLELEIAAVLVVAQRLKAPAATTTPTTVFVDALISRIVLLCALLIGVYVGARTPEKIWFWQEHALTFPQVAELLPPEPHLLAEDCTPIVLLGKRPVVMDAFAFKVLTENGAIDDQKLADRITRREFNGLIMLRRVDDPKDQFNQRLTAFHFGPKVTDALIKAYRFDKQVGQYYLYLPRSEESAGEGGSKR